MSKSVGYRKNASCTRSEAFHKVCVQEKEVYIDSKYAHFALSSES